MERNAGRPMHMLLVEDSATDALLVREALRRGGIKTRLRVARDGTSALGVLHEAGDDRPDLIVLDLNLPGKDGRELLGEIKQDPDLKRIPVVVFTTSSAPQDVARCYELHANCYVVKPVTLRRFVDVFKGIQEYWSGLATLPPAEVWSLPLSPAEDDAEQPLLF